MAVEFTNPQGRHVLVVANVTNVHTHRFLREFRSRGWRVSVVSIQPPNRRNYEEFGDSIVRLPTYRLFDLLVRLPFFRYSEFHNINSGARWFEPYVFVTALTYLYLLLRIKSVVRRISPDAVFSIYLTMNGLLAARSEHPRVVCSAAGADISNFNRRSLAYWVNHPSLLRRALRGCRWVLCFDQEAFQPMLERKGCPTDNVVWLGHWGVEMDKFHPREWGKDSDTTTCRFLCSRPYRREFDLESILAALKILHDKGKRIHYTIATGARSAQNQAPVAEIVERFGCEEFVELLDHIDYGDLPGLIRTCDVYIDPINVHKHPHTAGWGVSGTLLETMACGLIPVISRRPSVDWVLPDEARPFVFEDSEKDLVRALSCAIQHRRDVPLRLAMRRAVEERANWNRNIPRIEELLFVR